IRFAGLDQIFITSVKTNKNKDIIGKNLIELGEIRGKDPYNATFDLIYEEENSVGMVDFYGLEEHIIKILNRPEQNVCTDGMISDNPHPRLYGSFPKVLGKYVREEKVLSLEEAIYKMTKKPAETFKLKNRGEIKEENYADIVIFDLKKIKDKGTFVEPKQYPEGIDYVIINGNIVLEKGKYNRIMAGKVLEGCIDGDCNN
ncbi:amidohydrolase family protein, partial [Clostridium sp. Cult2]|uniref:amidohydrolase family protein n=1 Tax=Clostridium sp. Cult2 TaxID=2079003 RepID=UPI001F2ED390